MFLKKPLIGLMVFMVSVDFACLGVFGGFW
jgi:hypothetical protein